MKLVIGIVRPEQANEVLEALYRAEVRGFSISRVQGHGGELDRVETYRGTTVKMGLSEKVRFEVAVSDDFVQTDGRGALRGRAAPARSATARSSSCRSSRRCGSAPARPTTAPSRRWTSERADAARRRIDTGDTAWMLVATALVLMMTPALGLFYAGLVRSKNTLNTFMMCVAAIAVATVTWAAVGYSLAFDGDGSIDRRPRQRLPQRRRLRPARRDDDPASSSSSPSRRPSASSPSRSSPAPWSSGCASAPFLVFAALWSVLVYAVLAHWAFGGGWLQAGGTLDFAGGVPVEMGSGFSALAAALVVGARKDYGRQALLPHNAVYVLLGAGLLWFGWFGFNGGSGFSTGDASVLAFTNTLLSPACTLVVWFALDLMRGRKVTAIGAATAIVVGCVAITPAGGYISPGWAMLLGALGGAAQLRDHRLAHAHPGRRDARRARRPRHRRLLRHPLHRLLRPGRLERRLRRPLLRQRRPARRPGAGRAGRPGLRLRRHLRAAAS